jgi:uncharacterized membrane protein
VRPTPGAGQGTARLVGVDAARCVALLGMMATHVLHEADPDGSVSTSQWLFGGRASALFAVLAGVSLALVAERAGAREERKRSYPRLAAAVAVRGVLVAVLGLALGELDTTIAVILTYYGVMFVLAIPFLTLEARVLLPLAVGWAVGVPLVSHVVRPSLPERQYASPAFDHLADPARLLSELLLTGYYPALPWLAYLLLGLGLGRLDLRAPRVQAAVAAAGLAVTVAATLVSDALVARSGLTAAQTAGLEFGVAGSTPTDDRAWLLVHAPHSATPFDLAQTGGCAALVLGALLLLVSAVRAATSNGERAVAIGTGAGAMTLTLYSVHVLMRTERVWPAERPETFVWHVLVVLWVGAVVAALGRRGPLEWLVGLVPRAIRG